jgi:hypothetical protein
MNVILQIMQNIVINASRLAKYGIVVYILLQSLTPLLTQGIYKLEINTNPNRTNEDLDACVFV